MPHLYYKLLLSACLSASLVANAQTHCTKNEVEYFTCKISGSEKIVSICGSDFRAGTHALAEIVDDAWLQYRFGKPGQLELVFPAKRHPLLSHFSGELILSNDRRLYALTFKRRSYSYEILYSPGFRGVTVQGLGSNVKLPCDGEPKIPLGKGLNDFYELVITLNRQK
ncbi:hypothetical protein MIZ03_1082 [Rhodoferax lithotrophicus]|uniref:Uncharacterized protein n=1 Tax=Rhodoferax lithotrophicus TaxID=2798804 RepID=A0ABM7MIW6_9BURK|nr:hypothetical protein [Rhodoferax sp. MIZ03]BCO26202.1 hypothetical protein MIZ03_1082 [Rhodoferax sp. MIZ03]